MEVLQVTVVGTIEARNAPNSTHDMQLATAYHKIYKTVHINPRTRMHIINIARCVPKAERGMRFCGANLRRRYWGLASSNVQIEFASIPRIVLYECGSLSVLRGVCNSPCHRLYEANLHAYTAAVPLCSRVASRYYNEYVSHLPALCHLLSTTLKLDMYRSFVENAVLHFYTRVRALVGARTPSFGAPGLPGFDLPGLW